MSLDSLLSTSTNIGSELKRNGRLSKKSYLSLKLWNKLRALLWLKLLISTNISTTLPTIGPIEASHEELWQSSLG